MSRLLPLGIVLSMAIGLSADEKPRAILADLRADYCASCVGHSTDLAALQSALPAGAAQTVTFDVSTPAARTDSKSQARRLGISYVFEQHRFQPGAYAIITHLRPMQVIRLTNDRPVEELVEHIRQVLAEPPANLDAPHTSG